MTRGLPQAPVSGISWRWRGAGVALRFSVSLRRPRQWLYGEAWRECGCRASLRRAAKPSRAAALEALIQVLVGTAGGVIQLVTRCASAEEFIERFARYTTATDVVVPALPNLTVGATGPFVICLNDRSIILKGRCEVTEIRRAPVTAGAALGPTLMRLHLREMDAHSAGIHLRLMERQASAHRGPALPGVTPSPPREAVPAAAPVAADASEATVVSDAGSRSDSKPTAISARPRPEARVPGAAPRCLRTRSAISTPPILASFVDLSCWRRTASTPHRRPRDARRPARTALVESPAAWLLTGVCRRHAVAGYRAGLGVEGGSCRRRSRLAAAAGRADGACFVRRAGATKRGSDSGDAQLRRTRDDEAGGRGGLLGRHRARVEPDPKRGGPWQRDRDAPARALCGGTRTITADRARDASSPNGFPPARQVDGDVLAAARVHPAEQAPPRTDAPRNRHPALRARPHRGFAAGLPALAEDAVHEGAQSRSTSGSSLRRRSRDECPRRHRRHAHRAASDRPSGPARGSLNERLAPSATARRRVGRSAAYRSVPRVLQRAHELVGPFLLGKQVRLRELSRRRVQLVRSSRSGFSAMVFAFLEGRHRGAFARPGAALDQPRERAPQAPSPGRLSAETRDLIAQLRDRCSCDRRQSSSCGAGRATAQLLNGLPVRLDRGDLAPKKCG